MDDEPLESRAMSEREEELLDKLDKRRLHHVERSEHLLATTSTGHRNAAADMAKASAHATLALLYQGQMHVLGAARPAMPG